MFIYRSVIYSSHTHIIKTSYFTLSAINFEQIQQFSIFINTESGINYASYVFDYLRHFTNEILFHFEFLLNELLQMQMQWDDLMCNKYTMTSTFQSL